MRVLLVGAVLVVGGTVGAGLDVAHLAFFASEPVMVWTAPGEGEPVLLWCGEPVSVPWTKIPDGDRVRWEARLPKEAPLGVWVACTPEGRCAAFLRVGDDRTILEVRTVPGAQVTLDGEEAMADPAGRAFFVAEPGAHELSARLGGIGSESEVALQARQRTVLLLAMAEAELSSPVALPQVPNGQVITLTVHVASPVDLPTLGAELVLPPGWDGEANPDVFDPVLAGHRMVRSWRVRVPADAAVGAYTLSVALPALDLVARADLVVDRCLPERVVIAHWDAHAGQPDLSLPGELTYDRLLWARPFVGQALPFACPGNVFTRDEFEALVREWAGGS